MSDEKKSPVKNPLKGLTSKKKEKPEVKSSGKSAPKSRSQRILRGPLFWIVVAIFAVTIFGQISGAGNRYTEIGTSQALDALAQS